MTQFFEVEPYSLYVPARLVNNVGASGAAVAPRLDWLDMPIGPVNVRVVDVLVSWKVLSASFLVGQAAGEMAGKIWSQKINDVTL